MTSPAHVQFSEVQRWHPRWRYLALPLLLPPAFLAWNVGSRGLLDLGAVVGTMTIAFAVLAFTLLAAPQLLFLSRVEMRTEIARDGISLGTVLGQRWIPLGHIRSATATRYHPLRDFGGWGVRHGRGRQVFSSHGNNGVLLVLHDGAQVLIGSQRSTELLATLFALGVSAGFDDAASSPGKAI